MDPRVDTTIRTCYKAVAPVSQLILGVASFSVTLGGQGYLVDAHTVDGVDFTLLLSGRFVRRHKAILDFRKEQVFFANDVAIPMVSGKDADVSAYLTAAVDESMFKTSRDVEYLRDTAIFAICKYSREQVGGTQLYCRRE